MLRKFVTGLIVIFILAWVVQNPSAAGDSVHSWIAAVLAFMHHVG